MKLKIFKPSAPKAPTEREVYLKLEEHPEGIWLVACKEDGTKLFSGNLLSICKKGVYFHNGIRGDLGFDLDHDGELFSVDTVEDLSGKEESRELSGHELCRAFRHLHG